MSFTEIAVKLETGSVTIPKEELVIDFPFCKFSCGFSELVFAGSTDYEKDFTSIIRNIGDVSGSVVVSLIDKLSNETVLTGSSAYGTDYPVGGFNGKPTIGGYLIDWTKVRDTLGLGKYTIKVVQSFFGQVDTKEPWSVILANYSPERADGTVKIQTVQNKCIPGVFDYSGLNWLQSLRIPGTLNNKRRIIEATEYLGNDLKLKQRQDKIKYEYTLGTSILADFVINPFLDGNILAETIKLTDYSLKSQNQLIDIEVRPKEIVDTKEVGRALKNVFQVVFKDVDESSVTYS